MFLFLVYEILVTIVVVVRWSYLWIRFGSLREVDIRPHGPFAEVLSRSRIVSQRRFRVVHRTLRQFSQMVHLKRRNTGLLWFAQDENDKHIVLRYRCTWYIGIIRLKNGLFDGLGVKKRERASWWCSKVSVLMGNGVVLRTRWRGNEPRNKCASPARVLGAASIY